MDQEGLLTLLRMQTARPQQRIAAAWQLTLPTFVKEEKDENNGKQEIFALGWQCVMDGGGGKEREKEKRRPLYC